MCVDPQTILLVTNIPNKCSKRVCERTLLSLFRLTFINFHVFVSGYEKYLESQRLEWSKFKKSEGFGTGCHLKLIKKVCFA